MKLTLKRVFTKFLFFIRIADIFRILTQRNKTTIIYYHNISVKTFESHINFLKKKYSIVHLNDYLNNKIPKELKYRLIITFDDGYKENFQLQQILRKNKISATIFLVSGVFNTNFGFWFLNVTNNIEKKKLKQLSNKERIELLEKKKIFQQSTESNNRISLNLEELNEMKNFSFGSHTVFHPCLDMCSNEEALFEIKESKQQLEKLLNEKVLTLAFPDGSFGSREIQLSKESGYKAVLTSISGLNSFDFKSFELKRMSVVDHCSIYELYLRTTGIWFFLRKFFH